MKTNLFKSIPKFEIAETYANMLFDDFCKHIDVIGGIEHIDIEESVYRFLKTKSTKLNDIEVTDVYQIDKKALELRFLEREENEFCFYYDNYSYIDIKLNNEDYDIRIPHSKVEIKGGGSFTSFISYKTLQFQQLNNINPKCRFHIMDIYIRACLNSNDDVEFSNEFSKILVANYFYQTAECNVGLSLQNNNLSCFLNAFIEIAINENLQELENFTLGKIRTDHSTETSADEILVKYSEYEHFGLGKTFKIDKDFEFIAKLQNHFLKFKIYECDDIEKTPSFKHYNPYFKMDRRIEMLLIEKSENNRISIDNEEGFATDQYFELFKMALYDNCSALVIPEPENIEHAYTAITSSSTHETVFLIDYIAEKEGITTRDVKEYIKNNLQEGET
ncbi:hypothetical protein ACQ9ZH_21080 [Pseudomonas chlororaphis]